MKIILFLIISSFLSANQWDTEKLQLTRITDTEEIQNIHNAVFRFYVMNRNSMNPRVVSANFHGENKVYLQHPQRKKCELVDGSLTKVQCDLEIEFFHMPMVEIGNETQVFGQRVTLNGRYAGMTRVDRIGYAYMMQWKSISQLKEGEFLVNWGRKNERQVHFSSLHSQVDLEKLSAFFSKDVERVNYTTVQIQSTEVSFQDDQLVTLKMDVFWRDIQHFGSHNTLETNLEMQFTLDEEGNPVHWEIISNGEFIDKGFFPDEENPVPPRKMGEKWFPEFGSDRI